MVGLGGVHVDVMKDVAFAPVPLTEDDARALLDKLKGRKLLDGVRGEPAADVDALARLMVDLGRFAADFAEEVQEVDLNHSHLGRGGATLIFSSATAPWFLS